MNPDLDSLIRGRLAGTLTEEEADTLQAALTSDPELRRIYLDHINLECALVARAGSSDAMRELIAFPAAAQPQLGRWLQWRSIAAAAAGLVVGALTASVAWAFTSGRIAREQELSLVDPSFEHATPQIAHTVPSEAGVWAGDPTEAVAEFAGVRPHAGERMVRFTASAAPEDLRPICKTSDLWQVVELPGDGRRIVRIRAWFNSVAPSSFCIMAATGASGPSTAPELWAARASDGPQVLSAGIKNLPADADAHTWQMAELLMEAPPGARTLVIDLAAHRIPGATTDDGFTGQFVDDVSVTVTSAEPIP